MTLKTLVEKYKMHDVNFIQIDTEGYDYNIFMQMEGLIDPDLIKIEIAHITYNNAVYMRYALEQKGYKAFVDGYDLIAYRF
jgi:Zn-dependent M32 family carboxypeptidase